MMKRYDNTNSGALFKNQDKESEKHADYRGELNAAGVEYWLNGWVRTSRKGTKFLSLQVKPKKPTTAEQSGGASINDEIPFAPEWR